MKKVLKWTVIVVGGLAVLLVTAGFGLSILAESRLVDNQLTAKKVVQASDAAAVQRGERLVKNVTICAGCHGPDLAGKDFFNDPQLGFIAAPNLTKGSGGVGSFFTMEEWELAIRRGVGGDRRVLGGMPSDQYAHLSDEDLAALVAYIESMPPVDQEHPARSLSLPAKIIFGVFDYQNLPIARIDHDAVGSKTVTEEASAEYGEYLTNIAVCRDCHGPELEGRTPADAQTGPPAGPDLTRSGSLGSWNEAEFKRVMRSGQTPDGRQLSDEMPWPYYAGMNDIELEALYLYLTSLP
jgi:cytochrome c553